MNQLFHSKRPAVFVKVSRSSAPKLHIRRPLSKCFAVIKLGSDLLGERSRKAAALSRMWCVLHWQAFSLKSTTGIHWWRGDLAVVIRHPNAATAHCYILLTDTESTSTTKSTNESVVPTLHLLGGRRLIHSITASRLAADVKLRDYHLGIVFCGCLPTTASKVE